MRGPLAATIEELRSVALAADDAGGHFPAMYARVTQAVERAAAEQRFGNGERMLDLARAFAGWYLGPRTGARRAPGSWQAAWDVAGDRRLLVVQHLLLGINAHVNHDLPQVVVELADEQGELQALRVDFDAINQILAEMLPIVLGDVGRVARWVEPAAARGGGRLFQFSLSAARLQAWRAAERLHPLDVPARAADAAEIDRLVRVVALTVARPSAPMAWGVPVVRLLEERDPRAVTSSLLGDLR